MAGSPAKIEAILGALRGGWVNQLVTDSSTAEAVLALDKADILVERELESESGFDYRADFVD